MSEQERERTRTRLCKLCGNEREEQVCPTCGVDLVTGDLVGVPAEIDRRGPKEPEPDYVRAAPRRLGDWIGKVYSESCRGLGGTLVGVLLLLFSLQLRLWSTWPVTFVLAWILIERCRAARFSPILDVRFGRTREQVLRGHSRRPVADLPLQPEEEDQPAEVVEDEPDRSLTKGDWVWSAIQGGLATLIVGVPLAAAFGDELAEALKDTGQMPLIGARASFVGTFFLVACCVVLAIRSSRSREERSLLMGVGSKGVAIAERINNRVRVNPYDPYHMASTLFRATGFSVLLALMAHFPAVLVPCLLLFPVLMPVVAYGAFDDLMPWNLWKAARDTPRYLPVLVVSAGLLVGAFLPVHDVLGHMNVFLGGALGIVAGTLAGVVTGIGQYDAVTGWVRRDPAAG